MKSHLKVKMFSLSAEMTYIRRQEEKWKTKARIARKKQSELKDIKSLASLMYADKNFWTHRFHRYELKLAARTTHLAYGFLKGIPYQMMENYCHGWRKGYASSEPDWKAIGETIERFSKDETNLQDIMQKFEEWLTDSKKWFEGNEARWYEAHNKRIAEHNAKLRTTLTSA